MTAQPFDTALAPTTPSLTPARRLKLWGGSRRRDLGLAQALSVLDAVPAIGFAGGIAGAVGSVANGGAGLGGWLVLTGVSLAARSLLARWGTQAGARAAAGIKADVRHAVLSDLFAGRRDGAQGVSAAVEGVEALDGYYARFASLRTASAAAPLILIAAAAFASPIAAGILLFTLIPFIAGMALAGMAAASESRRQFEALQRLSGLFLDRIRALPVLIAFQAETRAGSEIARVSDELERRTGKVLKIAFLSSAVLEFFAALAVALVAVYCGFNLLRLLPFPVPETLTLSRAFFVLALAPEVYAPLRRLAAAYHDRQAAEAAVPALAPVEAPVETPAQTAAPATTGEARIRWPQAPGIAMRNVEIRYGEAAPVLSGFDLHVAPGEIVAIVGPSGSGKSSLLHLLLGVTPVTGGIIEIGDHPLPVGGFAGALGWASQTPVVVPGTLADNIRIARRDASDGDLLRAAGQAGLTGDLDRRLDERGGGLSGGERRRLGLARALLSSSKVLLLDEPTANLDRETEAQLIAVLARAAQGRTTLIATHSEAVMALADRVVRL